MIGNSAAHAASVFVRAPARRYFSTASVRLARLAVASAVSRVNGRPAGATNVDGAAIWPRVGAGTAEDRAAGCAWTTAGASANASVPSMITGFTAAPPRAARRGHSVEQGVDPWA